MDKQPDMQGTICKERLQWGVAFVKEIAKEEGIAFDKELLIEGIEVGKAIFVRKEMGFSNRPNPNKQ